MWRFCVLCFFSLVAWSIFSLLGFADKFTFSLWTFCLVINVLSFSERRSASLSAVESAFYLELKYFLEWETESHEVTATGGACKNAKLYCTMIQAIEILLN